MVGVPGKSKGCNTCRRRKKGCDQKRPVCGQCAHSGYVCGGYQRDLTFLLHPSSKTVEKATFLPMHPRTSIPRLALSPDRAAIEMQCRDLFWDLYLPSGVAEARSEMRAHCDQPANWTAMLLELPGNESSFELAFSALCLSRVGRSSHDLRLVKESTKIYGRALQHLQQALDSPSRRNSEEVLTACTLLGLYELFEGGGAAGKSIGWVSHAQGAARLIELRGPKRHIRRQAHHIFTGARLNILYSAILQRKCTFLASEEWTTIPWREAVKTPHDRLVDTAMQLPELLNRFDDISHTAGARDTKKQLCTLLGDCQNLYVAFITWADRRKAEALPREVKDARRDDDGYPFESNYTFNNHLYMNAHLVLWTSLLVLATTERQIELFLASLGFPQAGLLARTTDLRQAAHQHAVDIVKTIPYCIMPAMGALGITHITFPMCVAFKHFLDTNDEPACSWMVKKCQGLRKHGFRVGPLGGSPASGLPEDGLRTKSQLRNKSSKGDGVESAASDRGTSPTVGAETDSPKSVTVSGAASVKSEGENGSNGDVSVVVLDRDKLTSVDEWKLTPIFVGSGFVSKSTFVYENPARYYIEAASTPSPRSDVS